MIVSGDASTSQAYPSSLELAQGVDRFFPAAFKVGVAGYPQGHLVSGTAWPPLKAKQLHANTLVTQMSMCGRLLDTPSDLTRRVSLSRYGAVRLGP